MEDKNLLQYTPVHLDISARRLLYLGFKQHVSDKKVSYRKSVSNGYFSFTPTGDKAWFFCALTGNSQICWELTIDTILELTAILDVFPVLD